MPTADAKRLSILAMGLVVVSWPLRGVASDGRVFSLRAHRAGVAIVSVDLTRVARIGIDGRGVVVRDFPLPGSQRVDLDLTPTRVTSRDTRFVLGRRSGSDVPVQYDASRISFLGGSIVGRSGSDVFLAISDRFVAGYVDEGDGGVRYAVSSRGRDDVALPAGEMSVFRVSPGVGGIPGVPPCALDAAGQRIMQPAPLTAMGDVTSPTLNLIEMAIDSDYDFFELFGDVTQANDYVVTLYAAVSHIYSRDAGARVQLTFVRIWDDPNDLFNEADPLNAFVSHWESVQGSVHRDAAQLLTGRRNLPYGGVAFLGTLCGGSAYSVAGFILGAFPTPLSPGSNNWDIVVTSHELGHNAGTLHTHDYAPLIDQCAFGEITRSTIMSYCHTQPGGLANIDLGFHTAVGATIKAFLGSSSCISRDCNGNGIDDAQDVQLGGSFDVNGNGIPDECEDCNENGVLDDADIVAGAADVNANSIPDVCELDCNGNLLPDAFEIAIGMTDDLNGNNTPDECEPDCDGNGQSDHVQIKIDMELDIDRNVVPDGCQDCNGDGTLDFAALDGAHSLWVAAGGRMAEFHPGSGVLSRITTPSSAPGAIDVRISDAGRIFVSLGGADRVREFDRTGAILGEFVGAGVGGLDNPAGMTFAPNGNLLICNRGDDSVIEFDGDSGAFVRVFVSPGSGGLSQPEDLVFGPDGRLYVTNRFTNRVTMYDGDTGDSLGDFFAVGTTLPDGATGLAFKSDGNLLVASFNDRAVFEYDGQSGAFIRQFTRGGSPSGFWGLVDPHTLRIGPNGHLFVSSQDGNVFVHMYDINNGLFLRSFYVLPQGGVSTPSGFDFMPGDDVDCNVNFLPDVCDISSGVSTDVNGNGRPDECESIGDSDADGDVDLLDAAAFFACVTGPGGGVTVGCVAADIDGDDDVDFADYALLTLVFGQG